MTEVNFAFRGKQYNGYLTPSIRMRPHYYWYICKDPELIDLLGEDVALIDQGNDLRPLNYTLAERHPELFKKIILAIKQNISAIL